MSEKKLSETETCTYFHVNEIDPRFKAGVVAGICRRYRLHRILLYQGNKISNVTPTNACRKYDDFAAFDITNGIFNCVSLCGDRFTVSTLRKQPKYFRCIRSRLWTENLFGFDQAFHQQAIRRASSSFNRIHAASRN